MNPVDLPPVRVPFAVRPTSEVRPDLWPLRRPPSHVEDAGLPTLVHLDAEVPVLVAAARAAVASEPDLWTDHGPDLTDATAAAAGLRLARAVAAAAPTALCATDREVALVDVGVRVTTGGAVHRDGATTDGAAAAAVVARLGEIPAAHRYLEAVALAVAEDVVLVGEDGRILWAHVCAPSGWDPGHAGGRSLLALHRPIPVADRLHGASLALARAIVHAGPHVRWVWGVTDDPSAAHHPARRGRPTTGDGPVAALTFRAERQTTLPLGDLGVGVFLIRVHRAPLAQVVTTPERRRRLAAAIRALPPDLARYKGVAERRADLLGWLDPEEAGAEH